MYDVFDNFLGTGTWHTRHRYDTERFNQALGQVVRSEEFNADRMADHMRRFLRLGDDDRKSDFARIVDMYRADAWAVWGFLRANKIERR
jgi:hypothetical protein